MELQQIFNMSIAICGALAGWVLKTIWAEVKSLQGNDKNLAEKISGIEVLVAGQYVKKDEMDKITAALFLKLDKIEDKIDKKVDGAFCKARSNYE